MKAISIKNPYATQILIGTKTIEWPMMLTQMNIPVRME